MIQARSCLFVQHLMLTLRMQYYLTNVELDILQTWATEMAKFIKPDSMVVELGSG